MKIYQLFLFIFVLLVLPKNELQAQFNEPLKVGQPAPEFSKKAFNGEQITLSAELEEHSAAVIIFYRGSWCPLCKRHLSNLQDSLSQIVDKGAQVIVVTPERPESIEKMQNKVQAQFPIIHDDTYSIMQDYNVSFTIDEKSVTKLLSWTAKNAREANGDDAGQLPVPATYIVNKDGTVAYVHFDPNYKNRMSVKAILTELPD